MKEESHMTPEAKARINIDKMLSEAGYVLQDMSGFNRTAALGVVVREYPTQSGPVDYLMFVDGKPVGLIEAKAEEKGAALFSAAEQSERYITSGLKHLNGNWKNNRGCVSSFQQNCMPNHPREISRVRGLLHTFFKVCNLL
jgi:type I site-specific restriction endonuclease